MRSKENGLGHSGRDISSRDGTIEAALSVATIRRVGTDERRNLNDDGQRHSSPSGFGIRRRRVLDENGGGPGVRLRKPTKGRSGKQAAGSRCLVRVSAETKSDSTHPIHHVNFESSARVIVVWERSRPAESLVPAGGFRALSLGGLAPSRMSGRKTLKNLSQGNFIRFANGG
jgi:hypothetical protein